MSRHGCMAGLAQRGSTGGEPRTAQSSYSPPPPPPPSAPARLCLRKVGIKNNTTAAAIKRAPRRKPEISRHCRLLAFSQMLRFPAFAPRWAPDVGGDEASQPAEAPMVAASSPAGADDDDEAPPTAVASSRVAALRASAMGSSPSTGFQSLSLMERKASSSESSSESGLRLQASSWQLGSWQKLQETAFFWLPAAFAPFPLPSLPKPLPLPVPLPLAAMTTSRSLMTSGSFPLVSCAAATSTWAAFGHSLISTSAWPLRISAFADFPSMTSASLARFTASS
mmetsp:Transcript_169026/g.537058  ORF Transcript_169026/g.537058 Transcript_169026/m.537058 type:complete len:281 (-) Transcript_169026:538-1380(-)